MLIRSACFPLVKSPLAQRSLLLACALLAFGLPASAEELADSTVDQLRRQQDRERQLREQMEVEPDVRLDRATPETAEAALPVQESPCFPIHAVALQGEGSGDFQWLLKTINRPGEQILGRCLGAQGINLLMGRMQNALIAEGYVTSRVLASPQDLKSGRLVLTLLLGRVKQLKLAEPRNGRATLRNALPMSAGDVLNLRDIEQGLENLKRVPTAEADIQIAPAEGQGAQPGESDLLISWQQAFPFRLALSLDDTGSASTGKLMGGLTLSYDHWWTLNDLFYISVNRDAGGRDPGARGSRGYTAHYSVPIDYWLFAATAGRNRYHQTVAGAAQDYVYAGTSANSEIKISRMVFRNAKTKLQASLKGWTRKSANFIDDTEVEVQRRRTAGWELSSNLRQQLGNGSVDFTLGIKRGTGAQDALPAPEEAFGEGTSRAQIWTADAQYSQPFQLNEQALRYRVAWRAQWNRTPLVPQDKFAIGGRSSVRGFSGDSVLSAERGWLVRNDIGMPLGRSGQELYVAIDYGQVGGPSTERLVGKRLSGIAFGLQGNVRQFSYDIFSGCALYHPDRFEADGMSGGFNLNLAF